MQNNISLSEISPENIKILIRDISNPVNDTRLKAEEILNTIKYEQRLYEILFAYFIDENERKDFKILSLLIMKNLVRAEINSVKSRLQLNSTDSGI
jgi:hypothetical protein